jgi:hypothetical protein
MGLGAAGDLFLQFADHERFRNLARLSLPIPLDPAGEGADRRLDALTGSPFWPRLRSLGLSYGFRDADAVALAGAPPAPNLRRLDFWGNGLTRDGIAALAQSPVMRSVTELVLTLGRSIGDDGLAVLAKSPHLTNLAHLDVADCNIGPKGLKALVAAPWAAQLVKLNLRQNAIRKAGAEALTAPGLFPRLRHLGAFNTVKTDALRKQLGARFGPAVRFGL